jgi:hypothetical protein
MNIALMTDDFDIVMENPAIYYSHPAEIVADPRLTNPERIRLLDEWNMDICNKLSADEEGMIPPRASDSADDAVIMEEIAKARAKVEETDPGPEGVIAAMKRIWHRL